MKKIVFLLVVFSGLIFMSCNDDKDTTGPSIEVINPTENKIYKPGDEVGIYMKLSDETNLAYYKYEAYSLEHNFLDVKKEIELEYVITEIIVKHSFILPKYTNGNNLLPDGDYILKITAVDRYGNTSEFIRNFKVKSGE